MDRSAIKKHLIDKFKAEFYEKLGYYPMVITNEIIDRQSKIMTLSELEEMFNDLLPHLYGKKIALKSKNRNRAIVELRAIFVYLARCMGYKLMDISAHLQKHHSSIIHSEVLFDNLMSTCLEFRKNFETVFMHIKNNHKSDDELSTMVYFNKVQHKSKSIVLSGLLPIED